MKGRKPTPTEVKRKQGNPGKRELGDPVLVGPRLTGDDDDYFDPDELGELDAESTEAHDAEPAAEPGAELVSRDGELVLPPLPATLALADELEEHATPAGDLWREVCTLLIGSNIITGGDLFAVEQFVMATLEARRAYFELRTEGSTVETVNPSSGRAARTTHPAYRVWRDSNATMLKWGEHLGLTPVARARLGLAIGHGRKLAQELDHGLPANPVVRTADTEGTATEIDPYGESEA